MSKSIQTRITYERDGIIDKLLMKSLGSQPEVGKASVAARRMLCRYQQLIERTRDPDAEMVTLVGTAIRDHDINLLYQDVYPSRKTVSDIITTLPIPAAASQALVIKLERFTYAEYCKLIEAIEAYYLD